MTPNGLLMAALRYAELGYPVFPCVPGGKAPLTEHGFHDATVDPEQIERWWTQHPSANIGIPTEGLVVIDIDGDGNLWPGDPERGASLAQTGADDDDSLVSVVHHAVYHVGLHIGVVIQHSYFFFEVGFDDNVAVFTPVIVNLFDRHNSLARDGGNRSVSDGAEGRAVRRVHFADAGTPVQESVFVGSGAEHTDHHFGNVAVAGGSLRLSGNVTGNLSGILSGILEFNNVPTISPITFNGTVTGPPAITTGLRGLTSGGVYGGDLVLLGESILDAGSASFAVTGGISENGTGTLRKTGINVVTLAGNNTLTGNISIEQGIVSFSTSDALPDAAAIVNVLAPNAGVGFGYDAGFIPSQIVFDGNLTTPGSAGVFAIDTANWTSTLNLSASPLRLGSTANGSIGAGVTINPNSAANSYFFGGGGGNLTVLAALGGNASLEMGTSGNLAAGRLVLAGNTTFSGLATVRAGVLSLGAAGAVGSASALHTNGSVTTTFNGSSSGYSYGGLLLDPGLAYSGVAAATGNFATGATLNGGAIGWSANRTLTQLPGLYGSTVLSTLANPLVPTATYMLHLGGTGSTGNLTLSGFAINNPNVKSSCGCGQSHRF